MAGRLLPADGSSCPSIRHSACARLTSKEGAARVQVAAFLKRRRSEAAEGWLLPSVRHAPGFERYSATEDASSFAHEAG